MDLTKVGIALLNMKEISDYLSDVVGMVTSGGEELAPDVQTVAGEKAANIAIAYIPKDENGNPLYLVAPDRETVKNAMYLNGHALSWFWPAFKGEKTNTVLQDLIGKTILELTELRDEVYQMRAELARKGFLTHYVPYAGFYDTFRQNRVKHLDGIMATAVADSTGKYSQTSIHVNDDFFDSVAVGDHIAVMNNTTGMVSIVSIKEKGVDHETLYFSSGCGFNIRKDITEIYRSRGMCLNGAFAFGEVPPMSVDERNEMHTGFDDDTYRRFFRLDDKAPGYACTLRIPEDLQKSYLSKFKISVKAEGQPGSLMCTLIDEINIPVWEEIKRRERVGDPLSGLPDLDDLIVAKSMPLYVDPAFGQHIVEFKFKDKNAATQGTYGLANPECYPFLALQDDEEKRRIRYCAIIEGVGLLDANNYYEIKFLNTKEEGDVQKNNLNYIFRPKASTVFNRTDELDTVDLYYGMVLLKAVKHRFVPYNEGIYTARFTEPAPVTSEKARLTMRINREGVYEVVPESAGNHMNGGAITIVNNEEMGVSSINFSGAEENEHPVIIGTNIRKLAKCDHEILTFEKGFHTEAGDPVYPVGYKVSIKAYLDEWDEENCVTVTKYEDRFEMPLIAVMPDAEHASVYSSDRLVFEADLHKPIDTEAGETSEIVRPYNRYELEVYWEKSRDVDATITTDGVEKHPFSGAIQNLSLSLDRVTSYDIPYTGSTEGTEISASGNFSGNNSVTYDDIVNMVNKAVSQATTGAGTTTIIASSNIHDDEFKCQNGQTVFKLSKKPLDTNNILFYVNGVKYAKNCFSYDKDKNTITWTNTVKDADHPDAFVLEETDNVSVVYNAE